MEAQTEELVPNRALITICAMIATLMQALDSTIANVALPYMQGSLSASYDEITWVLTSYITAAAIMTAPVGWLANRFGLKRLFLVSLIGFTLTSMACGIATSLPEMVLDRLLQGMFGAALVPLSQSTILNIYSAKQRGTALAVWGMGVMLGPILGPTLGGYLTEIYNWRWVFFVNLPFGIAAIAGLWAFLPNTEPRSGLRFDWFGFGVLALGIGGFQLMLDRGETLDWFSSTEVIIEAVMAGLGLYLFVVPMCTARRPFITAAVFKDRNLAAGLLVAFVVGIVLLSVTALLAPWLEELAGYPVETAGVVMAPRGIGTMLAMLVAGRLVNRLDPRILMAFGVLVMAWSLHDMAGWTPAVSLSEMIINTIIQGVGVGFVFVPLQVMAFATLPAALRTEGAALIALMRNTGSAIGISVTEALITYNSQVEHSVLTGSTTGLNRAFDASHATRALLPVTAHGAQLLNMMLNYQSQVIAYADDFKLLMLTALPVLLLLPLLRWPRRQTPAADHAAVID